MLRFVVLPLLCLPTVLGAEPALRGPELQVANNAGQGWIEATVMAARRDGVTSLRDALYWDRVELEPGVFTFDQATTTYPDALDRAGMTLMLTVNNGNPLYDEGHTPYSTAGIAAFAAYAAEAVARFPAITAVEVGNEVNAQNFVSGPVRDANLPERALMHLELVRGVREAVKGVNPDIQVLGGATHSIPISAYLAPMFAAGAAEVMDALVLHPYTTPPEHLVRQVALIRSLPGAQDIPIEVTEFGWEQPETAPAYLLRAYCAFALAGVQRAAWYPLHPRGDGLEALYSRQGVATQTGVTFVRVHNELTGLPVRDAGSDDPFLYGCGFGDDQLIVWGAERRLTLAPGFEATSAEGRALATDALSIGVDPIWITGPGAANMIGVTLGASSLVADSYDQFFFPEQGQDQAPEDAFVRFATRGDAIIPLETRGGQDRGGAPWHPYRGAPGNGELRLAQDWLTPSGDGDDPQPIVHRFTAADAMQVRLDGRVTPADRSVDGVRVTVAHNTRIKDDKIVLPGQTLEVAGEPIDLAVGDELDLIIGPNESQKGDVTQYRWRIWRVD